MKAEGHPNSTANKMLTRLRGFLTWLAERSEIGQTPSAKRLPTARGDVLYLKADELARLTKLDLQDAPAGRRDSLDILLVCSATGQRFSDVVSMDWSEIEGLSEGDEAPLTWVNTERKNNVVRHVPLVGFAAQIVRRRYSNGQATPTPRLSNPFVNRELKEIARLAKLDRPVPVIKTVGGERIQQVRPLHECVTTHIGRKTFVTLALQSGMDAQELLGLTHDDLRTLRSYAGSDQERRRRQMTAAFEKP
jgi:integrase